MASTCAETRKATRNGDTQASALSDWFGLSTHLTKEDGDDGNDDVPKTRGRQSNILLVA